jgi:hypothetical protein
MKKKNGIANASSHAARFGSSRIATIAPMAANSTNGQPTVSRISISAYRASVAP